ncbi:MAG TPA: YggT family protein [Gemmatimonadales bacterium]|nr:YggT family protein [Gemmatimonadales bacterium]
MLDTLTVTRYTVFGLFALSTLVAFGSWLVRTRRISPFTPFGRSLRAITDAVVRPVERRLVRMGGNPVNAGWWLVIVVAAAGVVFISLMGWAVNAFPAAASQVSGGPADTLRLIVEIAYTIVFYAIIMRVVASWLGYFQYTKWLRPVYAITDWIILPLRRVIPPIGMIDLSPFAALIALWLLRWLLMLPFGG